jgi:hypothetical protein
MKRIIYIPLILLILFSGINVKIASHFCGGNFSSAKVSLSGKMATCGMEENTRKESSRVQISRHCCDDIISSFSISENYVPSTCSHLPDPGQHINNNFIIQDEQFISRSNPVSENPDLRRPPGRFNPASVEQQIICIFRI